jgi:hypothetical protein
VILKHISDLGLGPNWVLGPKNCPGPDCRPRLGPLPIKKKIKGFTKKIDKKIDFMHTNPFHLACFKKSNKKQNKKIISIFWLVFI